MTTTAQPSSELKLIVTGATGFIGSRLVASAKSKGIATLPVVRSVEKARQLGFERWLLFEELDRRKLVEAGVDYSVLVHLVGASRDEPGCSLRDSIVKTTERVVSVAQGAEVQRLVYMSGYGVSHDSSEVYFRSKAEAEKIVQDSGIPYIILRASYVLGPGDEITPHLLQEFQSGLVEIPGDGSYRFQPVYVEDVIDVIIRAASLEENESYSIDLLGPAISFSTYVDLLSARFGEHAIIRHEKFETFIRRATLSSDPVFTTSELAILACDLVGPVTENCLGVRIRGIEETLDGWVKTIDPSLSVSEH